MGVNCPVHHRQIYLLNRQDTDCTNDLLYFARCHGLGDVSSYYIEKLT